MIHKAEKTQASPVIRSSPIKYIVFIYTGIYVLKIQASSKAKTCDLDAIATSLPVKECAGILKSPITNIINYSLKEEGFPKCFRTAHLTPFVKKSIMDKNTMKKL